MPLLFRIRHIRKSSLAPPDVKSPASVAESNVARVDSRDIIAAGSLSSSATKLIKCSEEFDYAAQFA